MSYVLLLSLLPLLAATYPTRSRVRRVRQAQARRLLDAAVEAESDGLPHTARYYRALAAQLTQETTR